MNNWLIIRTRSRWEKKVSRVLNDMGIACYCPIVKEERSWSDRIKLVEKPLFDAHVFIKITEAERMLVRTTPGVRNFVHHNGKPAVIKQKDISNLQQLLTDFDNIEVRLRAAGGHITAKQNSGTSNNQSIKKNKSAVIYIGETRYQILASSRSPKIFSAQVTN